MPNDPSEFNRDPMSRQQKHWLTVLARRADFLAKRVANAPDRPNGDWDLQELHALKWVIESMTGGDK